MNLSEQYKTAGNLNARIKIHELYSLNKQDWHLWLYDQYEFEEGIKVLELGCGNGVFWSKNKERIPNHLYVTLSDYSKGMVEEAKTKLERDVDFTYEQINIEDIPYENDQFDVIIANHMLYHVNEREQALKEVRRILKPNGVFYSSTVGIRHMIEFRELLKEFDERLEYASPVTLADEFGLENGKEQLAKYFSSVHLIPYEDGLRITDTQAIIDYLLSTNSDLKELLIGKTLADFAKFLETRKKEMGGFIPVTKATGLFVSKK